MFRRFMGRLLFASPFVWFGLYWVARPLFPATTLGMVVDVVLTFLFTNVVAFAGFAAFASYPAEPDRSINPATPGARQRPVPEGPHENRNAA